MTEPADGDGPGAESGAPGPLDVPPTRKHEAPAEPAPRESLLSIDVEPTRFPDDGPLSANLRKLDHYLGMIELGVLIAVLIAVVLVGSLSALSGRMFGHQIGQWWNFVVRKGTFAIALIGAGFAAHQQRLLAMDLVSRGLSPRARLVLAAVLKLFTIAIAAVLFYIGKYLYDHAVPGGPVLDLRLFTITEKDAITVIPIGAALMIVHTFLHAIIDADYLVRRKLPPERMRSGH